MVKIETIRHSLAHILAYAVQEIYPEAKFGIGPAIENGFYYDFKLPKSITPADLPKIEKKMKEIIKQNISFRKRKLTRNDLVNLFEKQPYKLELAKEIKGKEITVYESGEFQDLCSGPHVKSTLQLRSGQAKEVPNAFKLTKIAGAYWRGDEAQPMLTRIYGVAFQTKKELQNFLFQQAEAEKRDHRVLGQKLDLFHINEDIGPGLILWHPKGTILKKIIMDYAMAEYVKNGYQLVDTPHIAKLNLWKVSGHTNFYKENMMPPMRMSELGKEEKDDYQIKPMNCPFHIAIYKTKIRSYKDLPIRYTEMGTVYRYEKSGVLHGLTRVRGFTIDDAHILCASGQLSKELFATLKLTQKLLKTFGFKEMSVFLSTRPQKYVGTPKVWQKLENSLKYALEKLKMKYEIDSGGGAFYGPKIDIKIKDSLGRKWQLSTIQVDLNLPERFNMTYIDEKGKKQRPYMIHRALLGSIERFIGVLLEHHAGSLPLWLSPVQIWVIPIGSSHKKYAQEVKKELSSSTKELSSLRAEIRDENETVSKKIREGELQKIPYMLVVGDKEMKVKSVRIRERGKGDIGIMKLSKFIEKAKMEI